MPPSKATSTPDRRRAFPDSQYRFIGGKGGAGKTTCAAALGLLSARRGFETLVVSTDPAPSLGDALGQALDATPRAVRGVPRLHAVEVNAAAALDAYMHQRRALLEEIALRGTWLDRDDVARLLGLSLPGIDEVAALLKIAGYARSARYDRIVIDTAPTGHLLRMLEMPDVLAAVAQVFDHMQAKHRVMVDAIRGEWVPDTADALIDEIARDAAELKALLRDRTRTRLTWITLPEVMSVEETADALTWLEAHDIPVDGVLVNRVTPPPPESCEWCDARILAERQSIALLARRAARRIPRIEVPAVRREPRGPRALTAFGRLIESRSGATHVAPHPSRKVVRAQLPRAAVADAGVPLADAGVRLMMFGGKGGVGKTTCAAAAALDAARADPERRVLLLSTDPAHSLGDAIGQTFGNAPARIAGGPRNLLVRELDAAVVFNQVRDRFAAGIEELFARVSSGSIERSLAAHDRQVMRDLMDLAPPGVDELVAIIEVTDALATPMAVNPRHGSSPSGRREAVGDARTFDLIVMDTAPTGHALRLIEMPAVVHDWVKAIMSILLKYQPIVGVGRLGSMLLGLSHSLGRLRETMGDSRRTRFIAVTRPAALPRAETVRLLARLASARVDVPVVVVNAAGAGSCTRCGGDRRAQAAEIASLRQLLLKRRAPLLVIAPAELPPPRGPRRLARWRTSWRPAHVRP